MKRSIKEILIAMTQVQDYEDGVDVLCDIHRAYQHGKLTDGELIILTRLLNKISE